MKPILYTGLIISILLSGCKRKLLHGNVDYSGHIVNPCTGKPRTNTYIEFYIDTDLSHIQPYGHQLIGSTATDLNGNFSFKGEYDLTDMNSQYHVWGISGYEMFVYDSTKTNYTDFQLKYNSEINLQINIYTVNSYKLLFENTLNIINPDSTVEPVIYIAATNSPDSDMIRHYT